MTGSNITISAFLGGKISLLQPAEGHRAGTDAILLAASATPGPFETLFDLGAGSGAAGLAIARRDGARHVTLVEIDPPIADMATQNILRNGLEQRVQAICADLTAPLNGETALRPGSADCVIMNPPFHIAGTVRPPRSDYRQQAHIHDEAADGLWIQRAHALLKPKGVLCLIHRADALPRLMAALDRRFGDIRIKPVLPRQDAAATRMLIRAVRDRKSPLRLLPPLILHKADGSFTPQAEALHQGEACIDWQMGGMP